MADSGSSSGGGGESVHGFYDQYDDDTIFLKKPDDDYHCSICLRLVQKDPHLTRCCGNHFCCECITPVTLSNKSCPICNHNPPVEIFPNQRQRRAINQLAVRCPKKTSESVGCDWQGTFGELVGHLKDKHTPPPSPTAQPVTVESILSLLTQTSSHSVASSLEAGSTSQAYASPFWNTAQPAAAASLYYCHPLMTLPNSSILTPGMSPPPPPPTQSWYPAVRIHRHPHLRMPLRHHYPPPHHPPPHHPHHPPPPHHHPPHHPPPPHHGHPPPPPHPGHPPPPPHPGHPPPPPHPGHPPPPHHPGHRPFW